MADVTLKASGLSKTYRQGRETVSVLANVSLELTAGSSLAVVGPSGSGKSTLLNCLGALDTPDQGEIVLGTTVVTALDEGARARYRNQQVGFVFQDHHLLQSCTALENVMLPGLVQESTGRREQAVSLLSGMGMETRMQAFPAELSGGERQRVAIARALINDPDLLLLDEPTGNLDQDNESEVADQVLSLLASKDIIAVVVTHNLALAARFDSTLVLEHGSLKGA